MIEFTHLPWDSDFFGLRIARLEARRLVASDLAAVEAWCRGQRIDCFYFLADASDSATLVLAEAAGFSRVDERLTWESSLGAERPAPEGPPVRGVTAGDVPVLESIAGEAHRNTRFFNDGRFPRERCAELYRTWIRNSCGGWADFVCVIEDAQGPAGYATCHLRPDHLGEIGLLGVAERARGRRFGQLLVTAALKWLRHQHCTRARVATQGNNGTARRLYQRAGFAPFSSQLWYHCWKTPLAPTR